MPFSALAPTEVQLREFAGDVWKEKRRLEVIDRPTGGRLLRKHCASRVEVDHEIRTLTTLGKLDNNSVPAVRGNGATHIDLDYVEGVRLYTVLRILKELEGVDEFSRDARKQLVDRSIVNCTHIQRALAGLTDGAHCYPLRRKLNALFSLFDHCLSLDLGLDVIDSELHRAETYLSQLSCKVPFRDATPKNLILAWPDIWRGRATPTDQRTLVQKAASEWCAGRASPLAFAPIVSVDFSSCDELTVPEDDPIGLLFHEPAWFGGLPDPAALLWIDVAPDRARLAVGLVVRLYRLGGRRLSYRLLHANGYVARYADESLSFHLACLVEASNSICPDLVALFPTVMAATATILSRIAEGLHTETDWFTLQYGSELDRYYRDVYPY